MGHDNTLHVVWYFDNTIHYINRNVNGIWSAVQTVSDTGSLPDLSVGPDGTVHVLWAGVPADLDPNPSNEYPFWYSVKVPGGSWSARTLVYKDIHPGTPLIAVDDANNAYAIITSTGYGERNLYAVKLYNQTWSTPVQLPFDTVIWTTEQLAVSPAGDVHLVWGEWVDADQKNYLTYATKPPAGAWSTPISLAEQYYPIYSALTADSGGHLYLVWSERLSDQIGYMESMEAGTWSFPSRTEAPNSWIKETNDLSIAKGPNNVKTIA